MPSARACARRRFPARAPRSSTCRDIFRGSPSGSQQALDVERFRDVSADYLSIDDDAPNRIVDLRYSLVPNEIEGFWAIVLDPSAPSTEHVELVTTRENAPEQALRLLDMLF